MAPFVRKLPLLNSRRPRPQGISKNAQKNFYRKRAPFRSIYRHDKLFLPVIRDFYDCHNSRALADEDWEFLSQHLCPMRPILKRNTQPLPKRIEYRRVGSIPVAPMTNPDYPKPTRGPVKSLSNPIQPRATPDPHQPNLPTTRYKEPIRVDPLLKQRASFMLKEGWKFNPLPLSSLKTAAQDRRCGFTRAEYYWAIHLKVTPNQEKKAEDEKKLEQQQSRLRYKIGTGKHWVPPEDLDDEALDRELASFYDGGERIDTGSSYMMDNEATAATAATAATETDDILSIPPSQINFFGKTLSPSKVRAMSNSVSEDTPYLGPMEVYLADHLNVAQNH